MKEDIPTFLESPARRKITKGLLTGGLASYFFGPAIVGMLTKKNTSLGPMACKTPIDQDDPPANNTYYIKVKGKAISENFPTLSGAQITVAGQTITPGGTITYNSGDHNGSTTIELYMTGGHDEVLCMRAPGGTSNISQTQEGTPISVNLSTLGPEARSGDQVSLVLYKIPADIKIADVKEALTLGTAVYDQPVSFYPVNEGYTASQFENIKTSIQSKVNNALNQIAAIYGVPGCNYDPNKTNGNQRIRLSPSYFNPGHVESGSGIMSWSEIKVTSGAPIEDYLEELFQAMGVRDDIGADNDLSDNISNNTGTLNQFGRNLMLINYFLNPNTKL